MHPISIPPIKDIVPNSELVGLMLGAKNNNNAPKIINANPPAFFDLLCSLWAILNIL